MDQQILLILILLFLVASTIMMAVILIRNKAKPATSELEDEKNPALQMLLQQINELGRNVDSNVTDMARGLD